MNAEKVISSHHLNVLNTCIWFVLELIFVCPPLLWENAYEVFVFKILRAITAICDIESTSVNPARNELVDVLSSTLILDTLTFDE